MGCPEIGSDHAHSPGIAEFSFGHSIGLGPDGAPPVPPSKNDGLGWIAKWRMAANERPHIPAHQSVTGSSAAIRFITSAAAAA